MNTFEFIRGLQKIDVKATAIQSVQENEAVIISDSIVANAEGLTFAGNKISSVKPFTDWEESGQFHENLRFRDKSDIEFTSNGDGADAVFGSFPYNDTIAPHAKTLAQSTLNDIRKSFINIINNTIK